MEETISVKTRGNVFNGKAELVISSRVQACAKSVAEYAEEQIHNRLGQVLQHPTGAYEDRINVRGVNQYAYAVNDDNCIYGPWLEGTGSRNSPVTRFRGYSTFRLVAQDLQGASVIRDMAESEIAAGVKEANL